MTAATDTLESPPAAPRALVVCADPTLHRSGIGRQVAAAAAGLPGVQLRDLYQLYPDFYIDVRGERALLASAPLLVFAFRLSWYAMPALLKEWCDTVLAPAWAGAAPPRLGGKALLAAVACDSRAEDYRPGARHGRPLEDYLAPLAQTAHACGMRWLDPHRCTTPRALALLQPTAMRAACARCWPGMPASISRPLPREARMEHEVLVNALIYLAAAVLAVPLAKRLGLGAVLGYLLAGIAIGPWGLGLIREVETILHFAEFGVVLLLFVIGLELEPRRLWALRRAIFGWGGAQVACVTAALLLASLALGAGWQLALIAALGLSLSSTAIALTTMQERNLIPTPAGQAGFAILLFQDIAAIPMIALVPVLGVAHAEHGGGWTAALTAALVIAGLVLAGRFLVRPVLRFIARTGLREIFTAFALLLIISIALLMDYAGMSMALGAFMAGVLLADSEYRHALETDLEPFKGLLLGLFFIAVGMSVDFGVFLAQPARILLLTGAFLSIKVAVLWLLARPFGMAGRQRVLFAFLLSQGGEFAFVVIGAAAAARVFDADTASLLVLVVALSMMATPLLLLLHDRVLAPRWQVGRARAADAIDANQGHVIVAGFGRFGQIVGRLLHANGVPLTMLDHDPDQIATLREFGFQVFYGDATRTDLLHAAGAKHARALVLAIDGIDDSLKLAAAVRAEFPDLPILARARNVTHYYQLLDLGVTVIERETFESALMLGRRVMEELGFGAYLARQAAMRFREHNLRSVFDLYPYYRDRERYRSMARQARAELQAMFERDFSALRDAEDERGSDRPAP